MPDDSYWVDGWDDEIEDPDELEALRGYQDGRKESDDFKEVATKLAEAEANYLDNLREKIDFNYVDADYVEFDTQAVSDAAKSLTDAFKKVGGFDDDADEGFHYFLSAPNEICDALGVHNLTLCSYKGRPHGPFLDSNYLWSAIDGEATLFIDVYGCEEVNEDLFDIMIYDAIYTELLNFRRDAKWVNDGVYEEKMKKMEDIC